jgi:hypothetical protein
MRPLSHYVSPQRWRRLIAGQLELLKRKRAAAKLDDVWKETGPVPHRSGPATVVADALWLNPGYFLRLRLMIEALAGEQTFTLLGVLRSPKHRFERRALERIGFSEFVYIDTDHQFAISDFDAEADALLQGVQSHEDLLRIRLPFDLPASLWYDSVLKNTRHGRPDLDHPEWRKSLAETLAYLSVYDRLFRERQISHVLVSHAWGSEWAALAWLALLHGVPAFLVTAFSDAIRIRRFRKIDDLRTPVEFLSRTAFDALPASVQRRVIDFGEEQLIARQKNQTSDVNIRHAYLPNKRITSRTRARAALGVLDDRPIGIIYGHSWFDFPHVYGMQNFTDFLHWFEQTIQFAMTRNDIVWLLKPHPMESWYGGYKMAAGLGPLPEHIRILSQHVDTVTAMSAADAIVTVHGTAALEAAAAGVTVIAADRSYYSDWGFAYSARSRSEYFDLLSRIGRLDAPNALQRDLAHACFALTFAEPEPGMNALRVPCDSLGSELFHLVRKMMKEEAPALASEVQRLRDFLGQDEVDSFAAFHLIRTARSAAGAQARLVLQA